MLDNINNYNYVGNMKTKYEMLNIYRIKKRISLRAFAKMLNTDIGVTYNTLHGLTKPNDYNRVAFDEFIAAHADEIIRMTGQKFTV